MLKSLATLYSMLQDARAKKMFLDDRSAKRGHKIKLKSEGYPTSLQLSASKVFAARITD